MRPPKVYSIDEHRISPYKIDKHAFYVIEKLRLAGFLSFLVGGGVRDLLLNVKPKDFDIATNAKPEDIKKIFKRNCILIGRRFRLAHIRFGRKIIEVSTFRASEPAEAELILRDNIWGTPEQDVLRRDFTINGLFYDPEVQTVIDYVFGYPDIEKRILRTIGEARLRFIQDPVRMIRLIKFKARFDDLVIEEKTKQALDDCYPEIIKSSPARILEELLRMLESGASCRFFYLLTKHKLLDLLSPNLSNYLKKEEDTFTLLKKIDEYIKENSPRALQRSILISALLFYPFEKRLISNYIDRNKFLHLGIITLEARKIIHDYFSPFFLVPKKLKAEIISILTNQFRILPLTEIRRGKLRLPRDPFLNLALNFFKIRCMLDSNLESIYTVWMKKLEESQKNRKRHFRKR